MEENLNDRKSIFDGISDIEIWSKIKAGDRHAFTTLYKKYIQQIFKYAYFLVPDKDLVEDAIHDVFVRIWSKRNNQIDIHSIKSYLFVSVRREMLLKKKDKVQFVVSVGQSDMHLFQSPSIEDTKILEEHQKEKEQKLNGFIKGLTDRQREIIHLRFYQNLSYAEIANLMDINQNYAYNLTSRAINHLRDQFKAN
ncbi:MAG: RNA polymerase sigma factor [Cytophagales bacterium]|nr:RNA polymerase sigma factor [Cytophagales bacterium]